MKKKTYTDQQLTSLSQLHRDHGVHIYMHSVLEKIKKKVKNKQININNLVVCRYLLNTGVWLCLLI